jgi:hypothetical protein
VNSTYLPTRFAADVDHIEEHPDRGDVQPAAVADNVVGAALSEHRRARDHAVQRQAVLTGPHRRSCRRSSDGEAGGLDPRRPIMLNVPPVQVALSREDVECGTRIQHNRVDTYNPARARFRPASPLEPARPGKRQRTGRTWSGFCFVKARSDCIALPHDVRRSWCQPGGCARSHDECSLAER